MQIKLLQRLAEQTGGGEHEEKAEDSKSSYSTCGHLLLSEQEMCKLAGRTTGRDKHNTKGPTKETYILRKRPIKETYTRDL